MAHLDPVLDPTGRVEAVNLAIQGGRSLWDDARARLLRNKAAVVSMILFGIIVLVAAFGPLVWVHNHETISDLRTIPPTFENCTSSAPTCRAATSSPAC
jgi:oligopeptide transport system permease protein